MSGSEWFGTNMPPGLEEECSEIKKIQTQTSLTKATIHIKISTIYRQIADFYARGCGGDLAHFTFEVCKKGF